MPLSSSLLSTALLSTALLGSAGAAGIPVVHGAVQIIEPAQVQVGQEPVVAMAVPDRDAVLYVECTVTLADGSQETFTETTDELSAGTPAEISLPVVAPTTSATCLVVANFANGLSERRAVDVSWTWTEPPPQDGAPSQDGAPAPEQPLDPYLPVQPPPPPPPAAPSPAD